VKIVLESLREKIALAVATAKAYNVPAMCVRLGLQKIVGESDEQEAHRSKRMYVKARLIEKTESELLVIAQSVLCEFNDEDLADSLSEMTVHAEHRVSELVRIDILKALNSLDLLFGELQPLDELANIFGSSKIKDDPLGFLKLSTLQGQIDQWYIRNRDWSHQDLLTNCGALTCSQTRFFALLERLLHPIIRRDEEQSALAATIDSCLKRDGFSVRTTGSQSGYALYGITRAMVGVSGQMKNLIFASIGAKPELIFRDAINNDVEIVKHADKVLVFDRMLPSNGLLLWTDLAQWWAETNGLASVADAKAPLYRRLNQSVCSANSPGEFAVFRTYYQRYGSRLLEKLPALVPQVFLHYDPYTTRQRGDEAFLSRQRMDFLMMLENGARIVIEIDGRHHYATQDPDDSGRYIADSRKYAEMAREDRRLRSSGYEVYRFGGYEFRDVNVSEGTIGPHSQEVIGDFFDRLLKRHAVL